MKTFKETITETKTQDWHSVLSKFGYQQITPLNYSGKIYTHPHGHMVDLGYPEQDKAAFIHADSAAIDNDSLDHKNKILDTPYNLERHLIRVHKNKLQEEKQKYKACVFCKNGFKAGKDKMGKHINIPCRAS